MFNNKYGKITIYKDKSDPWSSHGIIVKILSNFPPKTKILDIGIASGTVPRLCKYQKHIFHGVEPNPYYIKLCKPYYDKIFPTSIENFGDRDIQKYQIIIMADVIEHLVDPKKILKKLVKNSNTDTKFIISVPNIANIWTRFHLLMGKWDYSNTGILDKTHLHFYTKRSYNSLLLESGLYTRQSFVTPVPLNLVHPIFNTPSGSLIHKSLAQITPKFDKLLGYQFVNFMEKNHPKPLPNIS